MRRPIVYEFDSPYFRRCFEKDRLGSGWSSDDREGAGRQNGGPVLKDLTRVAPRRACQHRRFSSEAYGGCRPFLQGADEAREHEAMKGKNGVPVKVSEDAAGFEEGSLLDPGPSIVGDHLELQP